MTGVRRTSRWLCRRVLLWFVPVLAATFVSAERLPIRVYSTADGLPSGFINRIVRDSRGFLWFCTRDGLSRFDGQRFVTYTVLDGLPDPTIYDVLETREGDYWVATNGGGVCHFDPKGKPTPGSPADQDGRERFCTTVRLGEAPHINRVNVLFQDAGGKIWAGTDGGLALFDRSGGGSGFRPVEMGLSRGFGVTSILQDQQGSLWIGTDAGLVRRLPDGRFLHFKLDPLGDRDEVRQLLQDRSGLIWIGHQDGLWQLIPGSPPDSAAPGAPPKASRADEGLPIARAGKVKRYTPADGWPQDGVHSLHQADDGHIWIGAFSRLVLFNGKEFQPYDTRHGLRSGMIRAIATDAAGNLWVGSPSGAVRVASLGFTTYDHADGLGDDFIQSIFEDTAGNMYAVSGTWFINRLDGGRFTSVQARLPESGVPPWRSQAAFLDRDGHWWLLTRAGLFRAPRVSRLAELGQRNPQSPFHEQLGSGPVYRLFEDSSGNLWAGAASEGRAVLARWGPSLADLRTFDESDGLSLSTPPLVFFQDASGDIWIGSDHLTRYSAGRFRSYGDAEGMPAGALTALHVDRAGRLWVGTNQGGVARVDHPSQDTLKFHRYTAETGLSSNNVRSIEEDQFGRIYVGTARGVDRLNPDTGRTKHFTTAEGLADDFVTATYRDSRGDLWFGTYRGISRLRPAADPPAPPPPVWVGGVRVVGIPRAMGVLGEPELGGLVLAPNENQIQIDFFGLSFAPGAALRYEYMLEGADEVWSAPTEQRSVIYGRLAPGTYRFLVRAIGAEGVPSPAPASVSFRVLPPVWQRGWFLTLATAFLFLIVYGIHRYRLGRLLELERVRTRIATDLHDDIGSSLSQIAILSEVARRRADSNLKTAAEPLTVIADTSRELVDSMSDIVWATNPSRDRLSDLLGRMRRFASDYLAARNIGFHFAAPHPDRDLAIGADERRQVYLVFKEAIHNAARHSGCTEVQATFSSAGGWTVLEVTDNGQGFDPDEDAEGHGLQSMRRRAAGLGGTLEFASRPGQGTQVRLKVPASTHPPGGWRSFLPE